jgi:choline dehydrogenase-like flavoprotein
MFDYIVVGSGAAGSVLASRLSEDPSVTVCLLEAGSADRSALIHCPAGYAGMVKLGLANWDFLTVPQPGLNGRRGYQPRGKVLGGSTSINSMIYIRGQQQDYDDWAAAGNPGWSWADVLPYFKRAEHNERGEDAWHARGGPLNVMDLMAPNRISQAFVQAAVQAGYPANPDFNAQTQEGVGLYQVMQRGGERWSAAKAYLTPVLAQRSNLQVLCDTQALRVLFEGRRASGVEVSQGGARRTLVARREVLLCAGALQSPQILQLSGVGDGAMLQGLGLQTVHHLPGVGRNLHDHIDVTQAYAAPQVKDLFGISPGGIVDVLQGLQQWRSERRGILTTNFGEAGGFIRSTPDAARPDLQFHFAPIKVIDHARKTLFGRGYVCHVCLLRPKSRGSIRPADADARTTPLIDPAFLSERDDVDRLVQGFKLMRRILQQPAMAGLGGRELKSSAVAQSDAEIEHFVRGRADTIYHPVGSCRMGADEQAVVDHRLRVHGLQGLRVVDASVMPDIVSGNTTAPTVMIAEKASEMIRADA